MVVKLVFCLFWMSQLLLTQWIIPFSLSVYDPFFGIQGPILAGFRFFLRDRDQHVSFASAILVLVTLLAECPRALPWAHCFSFSMWPIFSPLLKTQLFNSYVCGRYSNLWFFLSVPNSCFERSHVKLPRFGDLMVFFKQVHLSVSKSEVLWCASNRMKRSLSLATICFGIRFLSTTNCVKCLGFYCNISTPVCLSVHR